jgi:hypothetical protein
MAAEELCDDESNNEVATTRDPNIDYLIDSLEDPFETFALLQVLRSLGGLVNEVEEDRFRGNEPWGDSFRHYSVAEEHRIAVGEHLIGSAFVLVQACISQAVSLVKQMHKQAGEPTWIPKDKAAILKTAAPLQEDLKLSKILIINSVADIYKHHDEWTEKDWNSENSQNPNIMLAKWLGMRPSACHNMAAALRALSVSHTKLEPLGDLVVKWREALATQIRREGERNGFAIRPSFW